MADNFNVSDVPESAGPKSVEVPGDIADGTAGEVMSWDAAGVSALVPVAGTPGFVLTENAAGIPTFQAGGGGAVDSVFSRTGVVLAVASDYDASQVDNDSGVAGAFVDDALNVLAAAIPPAAPVDSVFSRTGVVVAAASDYDASQVDNDSGVAGAFVSDALDTLNAGGGGGAWDIIASGSEAASASIDFINLSAVYRAYVFIFDKAVPAVTPANLWVRVSIDNGATFKAGGTDYSNSRMQIAAGGAAFGGAGNAMELLVDLGGPLPEKGSGRFYLMDPRDSSQRTQSNVLGTFDRNAGTQNAFVGGARVSVAEDNNAFQVLFNSGDITSMVWTLYGINAS